MKTNWRAHWVAYILLAALALTGAALQAEPDPTPQVRVEATLGANLVRIEAKGTGAFEYTTYRPSDTLFVVDLAGVTSVEPTGAHVLKSEIVSSYRVLQYRAGERAIVRVEVLMRNPVEPRVERSGNDLSIFFENGNSAQKTIPAPAAVAQTRRAAQPVAGKASAAVTTAPNAAATRITQILAEGGNAPAKVKVIGDGKLTYEAVRLSNPDRLVLDFAGAKIAGVQKSLTHRANPVKDVRVGQFSPTVARVVIDLESGSPYSVTADGSTVSVAFSATVAAQKSAPTPVVGAQTEPAKIAKMEITSISAPAKPVQAPQAAAKVESEPVEAEEQVSAANLALPETLTKSTAALASPNPGAPPTVTAPAPTENQAAVPKMASQAAQRPAAPAAADQPRYSGEPISVNFKDIDLKDFFRLIHEISGLNVVVDPAVKGSLTIVLDDVPWDQALDIALRNNGLDKQIDGNVLRIATKSTLKKEAEDKRDLAKAEAEAVDQEVKTRTLSYSKATTMRDTLKRFLSPRGEILADERSNTLIIRDIPSVFPAMFDLMDQLDRKTQQVEIEARVVAASRSFSREIGVAFGFSTGTSNGRNVWGGLVGNGAFVSPILRFPPLVPPLISSGGSASSGSSIPLNTNLGAQTPTSGATYAHSSPNFALDLIISAAESKGVGKLLSKPKIITQNNEKGEVKQGTKIPVQTVVNNTISVQFIDAVLRLEVTPQITAEGTVFMEVVVENTAIDDGIPRVQGIPALSTQRADTKVLISDGGTVVIGGVIISKQNTDVAQVPLLGSIPLIGHIFKRTTVRSESQELLFFLTPRIMPG